MQLKTSSFFLPAFQEIDFFANATLAVELVHHNSTSGFMRIHLHRSTHLPSFGNHHLQGISIPQLPNGSHFSSIFSRQKRCPNFCQSQLSVSTDLHHQKTRGFSETQQKRAGWYTRLKARLGCNQIEEYQMAGDNSNHLPTLD